MTEQPRRRAFVKSYGCQMNVYDSRRIGDLVAGQGYAETDRIEDADLVVLNTCHIRERASEKIYSELGKARELKETRAAAGLATTLVVAGCVAQAEGAEIVRRQNAVDIVVGPQAYHRLPAMMKAARRGAAIIDTEFPAEDKFDFLPAPSRRAIAARGATAFVTVQEGCDKFCSFCVVPYTRGAEQSRPAGKALAEIAELAAAGVREVTLLGQNVNAWRREAAEGVVDLPQLLARAAEIPGVERLRYTTSHPLDMNEALTAAHRDNAKLAPYLHLPVQSGSDRILAAMNRGHSAARYLEIIKAARAARPDLALSSDFIVGFPGESEQDFDATMDLVRAVGFAASYAFKYSARPGTPGAKLPDPVPEAVKAERLARLQALLEAQRQAFNRATVGRRLGVLFDRPGRRPGQHIGRSPYMQSVHAEGADLNGRLVDVEIIGAGPNSLHGRVV